MDIFEEIGADLNIVPEPPLTPELGMYRELTEGKMPRIYNAQYWLKHELHVYNSLLNKNWIVSKPNGPTRLQVSRRELTRALLAYYFRMVYLVRFEGERASERGKLVNMDQFLDLVIEYGPIKKLIEDPLALI